MVPRMNLLSFSALQLADLIFQRQISSEDAVRFFLTRAQKYNAEVNAFVDFFERRALLSARLKDRKRSSAAFYGVPIGVKDLNFVLGTRTRMGSRAFQYLVAPFDDADVKSLKKSGLVIIGKTTTSEVGVLPVTEPDTHPPTRNPWNHLHTAGGSSGGAGAAVGAKLIPFAQGSDGGGSVRIPASVCGLFGFKPSRGRLPYPDPNVRKLGLGTSGALAHTVDDAAALYDVMRGFSSRDEVRRNRESRRLRLGKKRLTIRLLTQSPIAPTAPENEAATRKTARLLEAMGHTIEECTMPDGTLDEFMPLYGWMMARVPFASTRLMQPATRWVAACGKHLRIEEVMQHREMLTARILTMIEGADFLLSPTMSVGAPKVGAYSSLSGEEQFRALAPMGLFTAPCNISGQPASTIPAGLSSNGLPLGVQIAGHLNADDDVLALSLQLEEAMPWRDRISPRASQI